MQIINCLVVKDEEGILRPQAGIWLDDEAGKINSEWYLKKNKKLTVSRAELKEI